MLCRGLFALSFWVAIAAGFEGPPGVLHRAIARIRADLGRIPDFVCSESVDRFSRKSAEAAWQQVDNLRFEVASVGPKELYARPGDKVFQDKPLVELVGRGTISTGQYANLAKHVFLSSTARFTFGKETEAEGRRAYEYEYDVPAADSSYRLRSGTAEALVAFQGSFWIDAETLDLIRLDVQAYDMPDKLGLAEANTSVKYSRTAVVNALLPRIASFSIVTADGTENLNRMQFDACRHYEADSTVSYEMNPGEADRAAAERKPAAPAFSLPAGSILELTLYGGIDPVQAGPGDVVKASVARILVNGESLPFSGVATMSGRVVRLEKLTAGSPYVQIGVEMHRIEVEGKSFPMAATMIDAGPHPGLVRQAKRLDPTFTKHRTQRLDVLVREVRRGQGILQWDARRGPVPGGLRMRWRVDPER